MALTNLFTWIDALWDKSRPEGTPPIYMMHRFLASDKDLAIAARYLQQDIRRLPDIVFRIWQGMLPKGKAAPRFSYVAPKKPPEEDALVKRMMSVLGERRAVVEEMLSLAECAGSVMELYKHFGVEPPAKASDYENLLWTSGPLTAEEMVDTLKEMGGETKPARKGGLLEGLT